MTTQRRGEERKGRGQGRRGWEGKRGEESTKGREKAIQCSSP
jgi:hypothetical protein